MAGILDHVNKFFMVIIVFSLLTYFERSDYNLPLFGFTLLLWNHSSHHEKSQKLRLWYLIAFSCLIDVIWIIYWAVVWNSYANRELGLCNFTVIISVIIFLFKLILLILLFIKDETCKTAVTELPNNFKSIFSGGRAQAPVY